MTYIRILIFAVITSAFMVFGFQNCSNTGFLEGRNLGAEWASSIDPFFSYYYTSPPVAYFDGVVVVPNADAGNSRFTDVGFIGSLSLADGSRQNVAYKVEIRKQDGSRVCPQQIGSVGAETRIEFQCVASNFTLSSQDWLVAWIQFTHAGQTHTLERPFR